MIFENYLNPKSNSSFSGLNSIIKTNKLDNIPVQRNKFKNWLLKQESYTLHRPKKKKFKRSKVVVYGIDKLWQADLVDVSKFSKQNNGIKYLLTIIDVFSKFAWIVPLINKSAESIRNAFVTIFKKRKPKSIQTDKGTEFFNKNLMSLLKKKKYKNL